MNYDQAVVNYTNTLLERISNQLEELINMAKSTKCTPVNPDNAMQSNGNKVFQGGGGTAGVGKGAVVKVPKGPKGK